MSKLLIICKCAKWQMHFSYQLNIEMIMAWPFARANLDNICIRTVEKSGFGFEQSYCAQKTYRHHRIVWALWSAFVQRSKNGSSCSNLYDYRYDSDPSLLHHMLVFILKQFLFNFSLIFGWFLHLACAFAFLIWFVKI